MSPSAAASPSADCFAVSLNTDLSWLCECRGARLFLAPLNDTTSLNVDYFAVSLNTDLLLLCGCRGAHVFWASLTPAASLNAAVFAVLLNTDVVAVCNDGVYVFSERDKRLQRH